MVFGNSDAALNLNHVFYILHPLKGTKRVLPQFARSQAKLGVSSVHICYLELMSLQYLLECLESFYEVYQHVIESVHVAVDSIVVLGWALMEPAKIHKRSPVLQRKIQNIQRLAKIMGVNFYHVASSNCIADISTRTVDTIHESLPIITAQDVGPSSNWHCPKFLENGIEQAVVDEFLTPAHSALGKSKVDMLEAQCNPTQVCSLIAESNYLSFIDQEFVEFLHQPKFFQGKLFSLCQLVSFAY